MCDLPCNTHTYGVLKCKPTEQFGNRFHEEVKVLKGSKLISQFFVKNPSTLFMYGLIMTHKPNHPLRPIVSIVGSLTYKLSK